MATQNIYALTDTWNNVLTTFTGIGLNVTDTTSAATSMLIDLQVGGASQFKVTKAGAATITTVELGHASDTTLSRSAAGVLAVEGVNVVTISATQSLSNKTLASPTLSGTVSGSPAYSSTQTFPSVVSNGSVAISYANPDTTGIAMTATTGTNAAGMRFVNTGGNYFFGADNSAGARLQGSGYSSAYAFVLNAESARDFLIGTNNVSRLKIDGSTGAAAFSSSVTALSATAIPAGGTAGEGLLVSSTANFGVFFGSGTPTLSAAKGSLYMRSDGSGVNDRMYVNTNGSTTWTAVVTVA